MSKFTYFRTERINIQTATIDLRLATLSSSIVFLVALVCSPGLFSEQHIRPGLVWTVVCGVSLKNFKISTQAVIFYFRPIHPVMTPYPILCSANIGLFENL